MRVPRDVSGFPGCQMLGYEFAGRSSRMPGCQMLGYGSVRGSRREAPKSTQNWASEQGEQVV